MNSVSLVTKEIAIEILSNIEKADSEDKKGTEYFKILTYIHQNSKFKDEVIHLFRDFLIKEIRLLIDILKIYEDNPDKLASLQILIDIADKFLDEELLVLIKSALTIKNNYVKFYCVKTLLNHNFEVDTSIIHEIASDLTVACLLYEELFKSKKIKLFPSYYRTQAYLSKSEMIRWLVYPTELGKIPDEIELIDKVEIRGEIFYVYKFRVNDPDNDKWMIGWAGGYLADNNSACTYSSYTFSHFDKYVDLRMSLKKYMKKALKKLRQAIR